MASQLTIAERKAKISAIKLPDLDKNLPDLYDANAEALQDDTEGAAAVDGSLVSFVAGLKRGQKSDVLNSTLFSQLAAEEFDRWKYPVEWYKEYVATMGILGWVITEFAFTKFTPSGSSLKLDESILKVLEVISSGGEIDIIRAAMESLQEQENQGPLVLYEQQSYPEKTGTFQISPCANDDGNVAMSLSAMMFETIRHETRYLWFTWSSSEVTLLANAQTVVLNEDVYQQIRAEVIEKLGDNARKYIKDITIARR